MFLSYYVTHNHTESSKSTIMQTVLAIGVWAERKRDRREI